MNEFSFKNIENFDNHISKSIRGFDLLDDIICNISSFFAKNNSNIIDLGCTSGRLINKLADLYPQSNCIGFDLIDNNFIKGKADLVKLDITNKDFNLEKSNLILSVFTMQFYRLRIEKLFLKKYTTD
jgi:tRNA (cmo5U34)-methyltransferase